MNVENLAAKLEGTHSLQSAAAILGVTESSCRNIFTKLKKAQYATAQGPKGFRRYKITLHKQLPRSSGLYDILNKYNPDFQLNEWPDYQVHGPYDVEDAIVDAIVIGDFRKVLATLQLFNHVTDWKKLFRYANEKGVWQKVGALYDTARLYLRVRKMPLRYRKGKFPNKAYLVRDYDTQFDKLKPIRDRWNTEIPMRKDDFYDILVRYIPVKQ